MYDSGDNMKKIYFTGIIVSLLICVLSLCVLFINDRGVSYSKVIDVSSSTSKTYYVDTYNNSSGDGSSTNPYNDFKVAYNKSVDGDEIVVKSIVTIRPIDFPVFNKNITILGDGNDAVLVFRGQLKLEDNLTINNIRLSFIGENNERNIYLNGYSLTIDGCTNTEDSTRYLTLYGGSDGSLNNPGNKANFVLNNPETIFYFDNIYAGGNNVIYNGDFDIKLNNSVRISDTLYANGKNALVNGNMTFYIGNITANKFVKNGNKGKAILNFVNSNNLYDEKIITNFDDLSLNNSKVLLGKNTKFDGINGNLILSGISRLQVNQENEWSIGGNISGDTNTEIMLNKNSKVNIGGKILNTIVMMTTDGGLTTTGDVINNHVYFVSNSIDNGNITFVPHNGQANYKIFKLEDSVNKKTTWMVGDGSGFLAHMEITGLNDIDMNKSTSLVLTYKKYDINNDVINTSSQLSFSLLDDDNKKVDNSKWNVTYTNNNINFKILDKDINNGIYYLLITESGSGSQFTHRINISNDKELKKKVTLVYDYGYDNKSKKSTVTVGSRLSNSFPTRSGYKFEGWYLDKEYKKEWDFNLDKVPNNDFILYAKWVSENSNVYKHDIKISAPTKYIHIGESYNPLEHAYVFIDGKKNNLSKEHVIFNEVNTNSVGEYRVRFLYRDSDGCFDAVTTMVIVLDKNDNVDDYVDSDELEEVTIPNDELVKNDESIETYKRDDKRNLFVGMCLGFAIMIITSLLRSKKTRK